MGNFVIELLDIYKGDKIFKKSFAFTLAETLIVMGIIGVVAALTIPNLNSSTADKEKVAKLNKIYSNLNDAYGRATAVYGPVNEWFPDITDANVLRKNFDDRISEFLKISKTCAQGVSGCFTNTTPKNFRGVATATVWNVYSDRQFDRYILADGTSVMLALWNKNCDGFHAPDGLKTGCGWLEVDLDGPNKGPHQAGKDIFLFDFSSTYGVYPFGSFQSAYDIDTIYKRCFSTGDTCAAWVINNGNMDYLKADTSGKCPNGKVLSETVTSCK